MRKKVELLLLLLLLAGLIFANRKLEEYVSSEKIERKENTVIIDPGHGSSDPGKVGINGALEKDINLSISKKVKKKLEKKGYEVIMTREKDEVLDGAGEEGQKVKDMKARVELINNTAPALAISIHQNSYPQADIHGAQVFYYTHSEEGEAAACVVQEALLEVDPDNTRQIKANDTYYLLKRTKVPTIIVECGFLSNPEEAEKLGSDEYQKKLADAIVSGTEQYLSSKTIGK